MKALKVSKLDIFLISNKTVVTVLLFIFAVISPVVYRIFNFLPALILFFVWIFIYLYTETLFSQKVMIAERPYVKTLDVDESLNRLTVLLNKLPKKCYKERAALLSDKIAFLILLGQFDKARDSIDIFKATFDMKKYPQVGALLHMNSASLYSKLGDEDKMKSNFALSKQYIDELGLLDLYTKKRLDAEYKRIQLYSSAGFTKDEKYEEKVLSFAKIDNDRDFEKMQPFELFAPYYAIYEYYKDKNQEKAKEYAAALIDISNYQLYAYRDAKDFLGDGDEVNTD